ncbi:MAG: hypothetical protein R3D98_02275 [Candidatus Krumholzibacteriia bacterium]
MFQQYFADSTLLVWPLIGLAVFVLSFIAVLIYVVFGLKDQAKRDHIAALPLDDDNGGAAR